MSAPFDALAPRYHELWSNTPKGWRQRSQVWSEIESLFHRGDAVLDLGCGTGDDALHLAAAGVSVVGIDSSPEMIKVARSRGVEARCLAIEELPLLEGPFDGAISNFGAMNCVRDLTSTARDLARLVRAGGPVALCLMSRFCAREAVSCLLRFELRKTLHRWRGRARWRGLDVFYPTARQVRRAFEPWFQFLKRVPIGGGDHYLYIFERRSSC